MNGVNGGPDVSVRLCEFPVDFDLDLAVSLHSKGFLVCHDFTASTAEQTFII